MSFTVVFTSGDPCLFRGDSARGFDSPSDRNSALSRKYLYKRQCNVTLDLFRCAKALCQAQDVQEKGMRQKGCVLPLDNYFRICRLRGGWNEMPSDAVCVYFGKEAGPSSHLCGGAYAELWLCWGTRQRSKTVQRVTSTPLQLPTFCLTWWSLWVTYATAIFKNKSCSLQWDLALCCRHMSTLVCRSALQMLKRNV